MNRSQNQVNSLHVFLIFISWLIITEGFRYLLRLFDYSFLNIYIWAAIRMTLMLLLTVLYIISYEKQSISTGFNIKFSELKKNLLWAISFALIACAVMWLYQTLIVKPIIGSEVVASSAESETNIPPFHDRLIEYLYIVYEGFVEVLIFIGFLVDRLSRRYNWWIGIIFGNIGFGLWHYSYWRTGAIEGTLMILMTVLLGIVTSLNYWKTKNSLSPVIAHTLIDSPNAIKELLGLM